MFYIALIIHFILQHRYTTNVYQSSFQEPYTFRASLLEVGTLQMTNHFYEIIYTGKHRGPVVDVQAEAVTFRDASEHIGVNFFLALIIAGKTKVYKRSQFRNHPGLSVSARLNRRRKPDRHRDSVNETFLISLIRHCVVRVGTDKDLITVIISLWSL